MLCNARNHHGATRAEAYNRFASGLEDAGFATYTNSFENEITLFSRFCRPKPLQTGPLPPLTNSPPLGRAMQRPYIFLQNLALRAIDSIHTAPVAGLGRAGNCTVLAFAQKRDAKPVGGRGISAFSSLFFLSSRFSRVGQAAGTTAVSRTGDVLRLRARYTVYPYSNPLD